MLPVQEAVVEVKPKPKPEIPASDPSTPTSAGRKAQLSPKKRVRQPVKPPVTGAVIAQAASPLPSSPKPPVSTTLPVKQGGPSPAPYQQSESPSIVSSVTPTASSSTVQSNMTTPRY